MPFTVSQAEAEAAYKTARIAPPHQHSHTKRKGAVRAFPPGHNLVPLVPLFLLLKLRVPWLTLGVCGGGGSV